MTTVTLRDAYDRWIMEPDTPANSYEWYVRDAHHSGKAHFEMSIPATKIRGTWCVEEADFERALMAHRARRADVKQAS